jgi:hypothetical protein
MVIPIPGHFILLFTLGFTVTALAISTAFIVLIALTDSMEAAASLSKAGPASGGGVRGRLRQEVLVTAASPRQDLRGVPLLRVAAAFVPAASSAGPVALVDTPVALAAVAALAGTVVAVVTPAADTAEPRFAD